MTKAEYIEKLIRVRADLTRMFETSVNWNTTSDERGSLAMRHQQVAQALDRLVNELGDESDQGAEVTA